MPRAKKATVHVEEDNLEIEVFEPGYKVTLGDREFPILAMKGSEDEYDRMSEYITNAIPIVGKVIGLADGIGAGGTDADLFKMLSSLALEDATGEVLERMPRLACLSFRATDPQITIDDVKKLAGNGLNPELIRAVVYQVMVDDLISQFQALKGLFNEFRGLTETA